MDTMSRISFFAVVIAVFLADQITKYCVISTFAYGDIREVIPSLFNLVLVHNKGAAFGIFADIAHPLLRFGALGLSTCAALLVVGYLYRKSTSGNIVDRARLGYVIDFLDFYHNAYHWPAFNIADSAICVGVGILCCCGSSAATPEKT
jgi:signal peptidase II